MKKIFILFLVLILMMCMTMTAFAADTVRQGEVSGGGGSSSNESGINLLNPNNTQDYVNNELFGSNGLIDKNVTTDTIVGKLESKGNDVVSILQTVGKYVCIAGFIISCILALVGIIGNKRLLAGAIIGLLISGFAYAGIVCGREIVNWIAAWAIS